MYHIYILFSPLKNRYYVGFTSEPPLERLRRHNTNHAGFTGKTGDWGIVYTEVYPEKEQAIQREKQIKGWKSRKMIEKLINQAGAEHSD